MKTYSICKKPEPCIEITTHIIENIEECGLNHSLCRNCGKEIIMIRENEWIHK